MENTPGPSAAVTDLLGRAAGVVAASRALHAGLLEIVDALGHAGAAGECGYRNLDRLLQEHLRLDATETRVLTRQAPLVVAQPGLSDGPLEPVLPAAAAVLADGAIGAGHLAVIAETMRQVAAMPHLSPAVVAETERQLAGLAEVRGPRGLARDAAEILERLDPDGQAPPETPRPDRELRLSTGRDGSLSGRFRFADPDAAETLRTAIDAHTADPDPTDPHADSATSLEERRAGALYDIAADALGVHCADDAGRSDDGQDDQGAVLFDLEPDGDGDGDRRSGDPSWRDDSSASADRASGDRTGGDPDSSEPVDPDPLIDDPSRRTDPSRTGRTRIRRTPRTQGGDTIAMIVTVPLEVLERRVREHLDGPPGAAPGSQPALLDGQWPVRPETARRLACDASVIPAVLGADGDVLDLGRKTRVVSPAQRRALIARDRHCAFPGCRRRPRRCHAHHVVPWSWGGPTDLDNLVLLCSAHHHVVHHSEWSVEMHHGRPVFVPPAWMDPLRRPRTNDAGERVPVMEHC